MENISVIEIQQEAKKVAKFKAQARKCGGYRLARKCNCYGLTLKYLFAKNNLTYKKVGNLLGITAQGVNHLVNRTSEYNLEDTQYLEDLCKTLSIDYEYFNELCKEVRKLINDKAE